MPRIKVGSRDYKYQLKKRMELERSILQKDRYNFEINQISQGDILFFEFFVEDNDLLFRILKEFIANILSDLIVNYLEKDFLSKLLMVNCNSLYSEEKEEIIELALNRLNLLESKCEEIIKAKLKRKNRLRIEIIDYIEFGQEIVLEGLLRFRLKEYLANLEVVIREAITEYGVEKEYEGFVSILKRYVDKEINSKLINVVKIKDNGFKLLDKENKIVENIFLNEYILEELEDNLLPQHLIISILISLEPDEIILHFKRPLDLLANLKDVFAERLSICLGCKYCEISNLRELEEKHSP